ncbi:MAG: NTPase [Thermodesulfobacteriota bacterium]|nr:NTPase [Thermodesulfobacteriota bacterium]
MGNNIFITGNPGVGKTTVVTKVVKALHIPVVGFYTEEIREKHERVGFKIVTFDGREGVLAHKYLHTPHRVGKYGVDIETLNNIGVRALRTSNNNVLTVVDEIGKMELFSQDFRDTLLLLCNSHRPVYGVIQKRMHPFTDEIKTRNDAKILEVTLLNREVIVNDLISLIQGVFMDWQPALYERSREC